MDALDLLYWTSWPRDGLFRRSAPVEVSPTSKIQPRRETHGTSSDFYHPRGTRHVQLSCLYLVSQGPGEFLQGRELEGEPLEGRRG